MIYNHHEQACAIAAEGYARITGRIGVLNVTTGPGGTNTLTGILGAWTDSIPLLVISGQVKQETCVTSYDIPGLRQLGDQEANIIEMVKGITKYAIQVTSPSNIRYHLEKALFLATTGRPGPCWLDIPMDIQGAQINPNELVAFSPEGEGLVMNWDANLLTAQCQEILERIKASKRPVILAGSGIRIAGVIDIFLEIIEKLGIPVTTAWTHDLISSDHPLFCGRPGTIGTRAGNFCVQNADLLLILGSRLNIRQVSYNWNYFAREAFKIQVDIDQAELSKPTVIPDMPVHCDLKVFIESFNTLLNQSEHQPGLHREWLSWSKEGLRKYPTVLPHQRKYSGWINPYHFIEVLFNQLDEHDVIVCGNATATIVTFQAANLKNGQRLFSNSGTAQMGYDLPAAIGAVIACNGKRVVCLAGDGSIQLNIQELQTIYHNQLPVKIFVLNNNGYLSIRTTQRNFFKRYSGESPTSGVSFPDYSKVAAAYGIPGIRLNCPDFGQKIKEILESSGPFLCEVMLDPEQQFEPRMSSRQLPDGKIVSVPLEDMFPFLDRQELADNLFIKPIPGGE